MTVRAALRGQVFRALLCVAMELAFALVVLTVSVQQGQAQTYSLLYSFSGAPDGENPYASLTVDMKGNLYGTTSAGGSSKACPIGCGTVFQLDISGKETVLRSLTNAQGGSSPRSALYRDSAGFLYGTSYEGGIPGAGTVFKLGARGNETVLHNFTGDSDGGYPYAGVIRDAAGNLYGTTQLGGGTCWNYMGCGTIFKIAETGTFSVLYTFTGQNDGEFPVGGLILDASGNLYGTTATGSVFGCGAIFKLDTADTLTVLYSFGGQPDGCSPGASLIQDANGDFFGTTGVGGVYGYGTVFRLDSTGKETVLYSFSGNQDGANPSYAGVVRDAKGTLYGTTLQGGTNGFGTVFKLDSAGKETVIHSFSGGNDGMMPYGGLISDSAGNLYGATSLGVGTVFKLTP